MSTEDTQNLAPWPELHPGDRILLRSRAGTHHTVATVAHVLDAEPGDGPGLTDTYGRSYRHYYYSADHAITAREISDSIDSLATLLEKISVQLLGSDPSEEDDKR